eukprot:TRINITY_DN32996_c0_g1_i1.p1 TRINITY_DN32996_c0_g1~~TRINITY_DN32996_c0_g1_i1.p1  ORF type:complete len:327 (+),score=130.73 TRINITY_DN32996_c0_g1_i1:49-1029(+)
MTPQVLKHRPKDAASSDNRDASTAHELRMRPAREAMTAKDYALAWVLENGAIWTLAMAKDKLIPAPEHMNFLQHMLYGVAGSLLVVEGSWLFHLFYSTTVYKHIPYFSKHPLQHAPQSMSEILVKWAQSNLIASVSGVMLLYAAACQLSTAEYTALTQPFGLKDVLPAVVKLAVVRFFVDIFFYLFHRAEHTAQFYWTHKHHHQHTTCNILGTNLQFHPIDVFVEGFAPIFAAFNILDLAGYPPSMTEAGLIICYMLWFEAGSHVGKELPTISYFPLLSFITRPLGIDDHNVLFHDNHHKLNNCNYGITQWCDMLAGTRNVSPVDR